MSDIARTNLVAELVDSIWELEILGTKRDDILEGGNGNYFLFGRKGNDFLTGGDGNDLLK